MRARTLWRAKSLLGGFYELQVHVGRIRFVKACNCTRLENLADAIERSWSTYLQSGHLI